MNSIRNLLDIAATITVDVAGAVQRFVTAPTNDQIEHVEKAVFCGVGLNIWDNAWKNHPIPRYVGLFCGVGAVIYEYLPQIRAGIDYMKQISGQNRPAAAQRPAPPEEHDPELLDFAIALSLEEEPPSSHKDCIQMVLQGINGDDNEAISALPDIPSEFLIALGNDRYCHGGSLLLSALTQPEAQDIASREPFTNAMFEGLGFQTGITPDLLRNIWTLAACNEASENVDHDRQVSLKTDYRFQVLHDLLHETLRTNEDGSTRRFLNYLETQEIWKQKFRQQV